MPNTAVLANRLSKTVLGHPELDSGSIRLGCNSNCRDGIFKDEMSLRASPAIYLLTCPEIDLQIAGEARNDVMDEFNAFKLFRDNVNCTP